MSNNEIKKAENALFSSIPRAKRISAQAATRLARAAAERAFEAGCDEDYVRLTNSANFWAELGSIKVELSEAMKGLLQAY